MTAANNERAKQLIAQLRDRILVIDGAMGTALQDAQLTPEDFGGAHLDGCNEMLTRTRPDVVLGVHRAYLEAGADLIETNTFGATPLVLDEYDVGDQARELNRLSAKLARQAAEEYSSSDRQRFVIGSVGPTTKAISVTGGATFAEMRRHFGIQMLGLLEGGVDVLLIETQQDTRNVKAALLGVEDAFAETGLRVPLMISGTIEPTGTMLAGQNAEAFCASMRHLDLLSIGLNCATGPEFMTDSIRSLADLSETRISCVPNAGLPDEDGNYGESPAHVAEVLGRFADAGWLNFVGGCCGTTPAYVAALAEMAAGKEPRRPSSNTRALYSGIDLVESTEDNRPLLVGERTNVIGSRKFKRLIVDERFDEAGEIARAQAKAGAQILDVCLANPDRDELADMERFLERVIRMIKMPLMIDSTDPEVIEMALGYSQGRAIINSINLEDGEERFGKVADLAKRHGAALVVGMIDEDPLQGMALTRERKLAIAERCHALLVDKHGLRSEDIIWDPLTFPCATGDEQYIGSAEETIEGIRLIRERFPLTRSILGVSNVSFGLPAAGREVLNAVYLYLCTQAGLDMAIVNTQGLERYASIPQDERDLAENLLFNRGDDPIAAFANRYRDQKKRSQKPSADLSLDERLALYIVEGTKEGLVADLELKRAEAAPMDIINGPLMVGMGEVGRLFNNNELIVAEVLQSAEAMKAAVSHLEGFMDVTETTSKGKFLLATVKGDVHDIGKNLVDIILSNNGYEVINLGIKIAPDVLVEAVKEHQPDFIGLSGLLVKSAQQMVLTGEDLNTAGVDIPLLVGGAALSPRFTHTRIAPAYRAPTLYAKDAMKGLDILNRLQSDGVEAVLAEQAKSQESLAPAAKAPLPAETEVRSTRVRLDVERLSPPDLDVHVEEFEDLNAVWDLINPQMLYGKHLGFRGNFPRAIRDGDAKAASLLEQMDAIRDSCRGGAMQVRATWRWFEAESEGNRLHLFAPGESDPLQSFRFPRQRREDGLCIADYILPPQEGRRDHVALFVTSAGGGILELSSEAKAAGEYFRSHGLAALALESAEAAAELLHRRLRSEWGIPDPASTTPKDLYAAKYTGKRFSFGYPACPDLAGQEPLFALLKPESIGVSLTEGHMMEPEASVSAIVLAHPDASYFAVETED